MTTQFSRYHSLQSMRRRFWRPTDARLNASRADTPAWGVSGTPCSSTTLSDVRCGNLDRGPPHYANQWVGRFRVAVMLTNGHDSLVLFRRHPRYFVERASGSTPDQPTPSCVTPSPARWACPAVATWQFLEPAPRRIYGNPNSTRTRNRRRASPRGCQDLSIHAVRGRALTLFQSQAWRARPGVRRGTACGRTRCGEPTHQQGDGRSALFSRRTPRLSSCHGSRTQAKA
jgi:hypothetical protein